MGHICLLIAQNIRKLRSKAGLSQLALATKANIDSKTLHDIEHAVRYPEVRTLEKIANALELPIIQLFEEPGNPPFRLEVLVNLLSKNDHSKL